ncbi:alpha/beta hydrolase [Massilia sp. Dwa41.01b]|uniref:alpha/beta fold hydrolase n=1 Tax=unclassified Massilia TaxID=2609279 RepID=UPI001603B4A2|nr:MULTISPECIES: alpha/beta hydrolase [unclassified Massilia]QNA90463.1 alpha/beta hydrolase [Massilia sp. Dwa41.01b]QNA97694.1 alpha/beta hydrolase [Massilia sp. Se16.2.3]
MKTLSSLFAGALLALPFACAAAETAPACASARQRVDEQGFVRINGIEQWITMQGDSCANPVILVAHGGPGNPLSIYDKGPYRAWEKDFTVVHWDQRGAGMTYGRNKPADDETLTVEGLRDDGLAVARHVAARLGKRKLILMGSSWGSVLAVHMAKASPGQFCAYLGTAQVVAQRENVDGHARLIALARAAGDTETAARIEALGPPPWTNPRSFGIERKAMRKYEAMRTDPMPRSWSEPGAIHATAQAQADYEAGEDYSFLQFVGMRNDGMAATIDLYRLGPDFSLPVYLVQGSEDLLTTAAVTQRYFDALQAPVKKLVVVPRAGHDPNLPMVEAQARLLRDEIRPRCL